MTMKKLLNILLVHVYQTYMSLIKHKPQNFKFNQANNNTSLWIVETSV